MMSLCGQETHIITVGFSLVNIFSQTTADENEPAIVNNAQFFFLQCEPITGKQKSETRVPNKAHYIKLSFYFRSFNTLPTMVLNYISQYSCIKTSWILHHAGTEGQLQESHKNVTLRNCIS